MFLSRCYVLLCLATCLPHSYHRLKCCKLCDRQNEIHFPNISLAQQQAEDSGVCLSISHYLIQSHCICSNNWLGSAHKQGINVNTQAFNFCYFARNSFFIHRVWRISPSVLPSCPFLHYVCSCVQFHILPWCTQFVNPAEKNFELKLFFFSKHPVSPRDLQTARTHAIFFDCFRIPKSIRLASMDSRYAFWNCI